MDKAFALHSLAEWNMLPTVEQEMRAPIAFNHLKKLLESAAVATDSSGAGLSDTDLLGAHMQESWRACSRSVDVLASACTQFPLNPDLQWALVRQELEDRALERIDKARQAMRAREVQDAKDKAEKTAADKRRWKACSCLPDGPCIQLRQQCLRCIREKEEARWNAELAAGGFKKAKW